MVHLVSMAVLLTQLIIQTASTFFVENTSMNVTRWELVLDYLMFVLRRERDRVVVVFVVLIVVVIVELSREAKKAGGRRECACEDGRPTDHRPPRHSPRYD